MANDDTQCHDVIDDTILQYKATELKNEAQGQTAAGTKHTAPESS